MKTKLFSAIAAVAILGTSAITAQNSSIVPPTPINLQGGPGIVTSISSSQSELPENAQKFLQTVYSRVMVGPVTHNVVNDTYKVELGNDVKITFNNKGQVEDIQAPYPESLFIPAIKAVLPEKAFTHLEKAGLLSEVTGIKNATGKGLRVQLLNAMPPEILFDLDGLFIILDD